MRTPPHTEPKWTVLCDKGKPLCEIISAEVRDGDSLVCVRTPYIGRP